MHFAAQLLIRLEQDAKLECSERAEAEGSSIETKSEYSVLFTAVN